MPAAACHGWPSSPPDWPKGVYICIYIYMCIHVYAYSYMYIFTYAYIRQLLLLILDGHFRCQIGRKVYKYVYMYIYIYIHAYTYIRQLLLLIYIYAYTYSPAATAYHEWSSFPPDWPKGMYICIYIGICIYVHAYV